MAAKQKYSFVFVLIRPSSLVLKELFFRILSVLTRLISTKTKENFFGHHLYIRSMPWFIDFKAFNFPKQPSNGSNIKEAFHNFAVTQAPVFMILLFFWLRQVKDPIHKWRLFYFCSVIVQIGLPRLALEQELNFSFQFSTWQWCLVS